MPTVTVREPWKGLTSHYQHTSPVNVGTAFTMETTARMSEGDWQWMCIKRTNCELSIYNDVKGSTMTLTPRNTYPGITLFSATFTTDPDYSTPGSLPVPDDLPDILEPLADENQSTIGYGIPTNALTIFGTLDNDSVTNYGVEIFNGDGDKIIDLSTSLFRYVLSGSLTVASNASATVSVPGVDWRDGTWTHIVTPALASGTAVNAMLTVRQVDSINGSHGGLKFSNLRDVSVTIGYWIFRI